MRKGLCICKSAECSCGGVPIEAMVNSRHANDRLDEELSKKNDKPVMKVDPQFRGREVASPDQLRALFTELEDRIGPQLACRLEFNDHMSFARDTVSNAPCIDVRETSARVRGAPEA